jgi:hypothetical protein
MKKISQTSAIKEIETKLKEISKKLLENGIMVRRENLTRGPSFRVRSGRCVLANKEHENRKDCLFIDKRLSVQQQLELVEERLKNIS